MKDFYSVKCRLQWIPLMVRGHFDYGTHYYNAGRQQPRLAGIKNIVEHSVPVSFLGESWRVESKTALFKNCHSLLEIFH